MDKLFRWAVILILSLLTMNVVIAEYIEATPLQTPVEVIVVKKKEVKEEVVEKPVKKELPIIKSNVKEIKEEFSWWHKWEVQDLIRFYAAKHGVDAERALRISSCESGFKWDAKNSHSTATWPFQFLRGTRASTSAKYWFEWESVLNAPAHIEVAILKLKNEWRSARSESKYCWNK